MGAFVIFAAESDTDKLYAFTQRLCRIVENTDIVYEGTRISITASFGAAGYDASRARKASEPSDTLVESFTGQGQAPVL